MIARYARDRYAEVLRQFVTGQITNFEYERCCEAITSKKKGDDVAIDEIWKTVWQTYDDFKEHRLAGAWALSKELRQTMDRCLLFLASDYPYEYEQTHVRYRRKLWNLLTFGLYKRLRKEHPDEELNGEWLVWPFFRTQDYREAQANPKVLQRWHSGSAEPIQIPRQSLLDTHRRITLLQVCIGVLILCAAFIALVRGCDL